MNNATKQRNKAFKSANRQERAVMVAKDALDMLNAEKTVAKEGTWIKFIGVHWSKDADKQICDISDKLSNCSVCALGAMLLSEIRHTNNLTLQDTGTMIDYPEYSDRLGGVFSLKQQELMEIAFEGGIGFFHTRCMSKNKRDRVIRFYERYPESNDRLRAILKNVIKNNGTFKV